MPVPAEHLNGLVGRTVCVMFTDVLNLTMIGTLNASGHVPGLFQVIVGGDESCLLDRAVITFNAYTTDMIDWTGELPVVYIRPVFGSA